jgi:lipopolysaccharide transport system permease protein
MSTKIYTSYHSQSFINTLKDIFKGFISGKDLAYRLFIRDFKASFEKSILGVFWVFLPPILTAGIWIFLNNQKIISIADTPMVYPAFSLCGSLMWAVFAESLTKPLQRYKSAMSMMVKLNFPRESVLLAAIYDLFVSLGLKLLVLIPILWFMGYPPTFDWIYLIPSLLGLMLMGISIGLLLVPFGLLYNDISNIITLGLPFALYLTPVVYPIAKGGILGTIQTINPVTPWLERIRSIFGGYLFDLHKPMLIWLIIGTVILLIGLIAFRIALPIIVERSGS